jgi:hypothetical protein
MLRGALHSETPIVHIAGENPIVVSRSGLGAPNAHNEKTAHFHSPLDCAAVGFSAGDLVCLFSTRDLPMRATSLRYRARVSQPIGRWRQFWRRLCFKTAAASQLGIGVIFQRTPL